LIGLLDCFTIVGWGLGSTSLLFYGLGWALAGLSFLMSTPIAEIVGIENCFLAA